MKKIIVILLSVTICIGGYSQNRNAEIIEDLCEKCCAKSGSLSYSKSEGHFEIGHYYIAGIHPEYLKMPISCFGQILIERIGSRVVTIYRLCHATEYTYESNLKQIKKIRSEIEVDMDRLKEDYDRYEKQRLEIERRKNSKPKEIDFKGIM